VPPELAAVAAALADPSSGVVAAAGTASNGKTFTGAQLLAWLQQRGVTAAEAAGASLELQGAQLLAANVVTLVASSQPALGDVATVAPGMTYRLRADAPRAVQWGQPLNTGYCELGGGGVGDALLCARCSWRVVAYATCWQHARVRPSQVLQPVWKAGRLNKRPTHRVLPCCHPSSVQGGARRPRGLQRRWRRT
jgi:hypothetical protein